MSAQITVDISQLNDLMDYMRDRLSMDNFDRLMRRTLNETGKHTKTYTKREDMKHYEGGAAWIGGAIGSPRISGSGGNLECRIIIKGEKGKVGGTFAASGGWYGWNPPQYRITAKIVKSGVSVLPASMSSMGGQPPFRNLGSKGYTNKKGGKIQRQAAKLGTTVFTRKSGDFKAPLSPVAAIAVPQMHMNRAMPGIENEIISYAEKRLIHNFSHMFG